LSQPGIFFSPVVISSALMSSASRPEVAKSASMSFSRNAASEIVSDILADSRVAQLFQPVRQVTLLGREVCRGFAPGAQQLQHLKLHRFRRAFIKPTLDPAALRLGTSTNTMSNEDPFAQCTVMAYTDLRSLPFRPPRRPGGQVLRLPIEEARLVLPLRRGDDAQGVPRAFGHIGRTTLRMFRRVKANASLSKCHHKSVSA
jgi:hypothetical protein